MADVTHADLLLDAVHCAPQLLRSLVPFDAAKRGSQERDVRLGERLGWTTEQLYECLWRAHRVTWGYDFVEQVVAELVNRRLLVRVGDRVKLAPRRRRRRR